MMVLTPSVAILALIGSAVAYPASTGLWPRNCAPGALACNGEGKFGICNTDTKAVWMDVAAGTKCVCSGATCTIAASGSPAPPPSDSKPSPPPDSQATPSSDPIVVALPSPKSSPTSKPVAVPSTVSAPPPPPPAADSSGSPPVTEPTSKPTPPPPSSSPPSSPPPKSGGGGGGGGAYISVFLGDGSPSAGWPDQDKWVDFDSMWSSNLENVISKSCEGFGQDNNSDQESADLKSAIQSVAKDSGLDERFIFAIVMQESGGCVRAPTTNYGVTNPGLMQSHDGSHSCYNVNPCSSDEILGMIKDGTEGTSSGPGLKQDLASAGSSGVEGYYKAARIYNSGSIASSGLLQDGIATHCYCSDIANRLLGWSEGPTTCSLL